MRCSICNVEIGDMRYAIRDMKPTETYLKWLWRHIVCLVTFGFKSRKHAIILPACTSCTGQRLAYNIAGASENVA
jgi:hypothetical protein